MIPRVAREVKITVDRAPLVGRRERVLYELPPLKTGLPPATHNSARYGSHLGLGVKGVKGVTPLCYLNNQDQKFDE